MLKKLTSLIVLIVFILFEFCGLYSYALTPYEGTVENPVLQEVTTDSITLVPIEGYEYSKDGMIWQNSNVFNNLTVATTYEMYQRVKETDEIDKSQKSDALEVTTKKYENNNNPYSPVLYNRTDTTITLKTYNGYEYSMEGENFQDGTTFSNLNPNTAYTFYQRIKETSDTYASVISSPRTFYTLKKDNTIEPKEIQTEEITPTSVILVSLEGYEYSINGENFQDNNCFTGLTPNTEYTFYQRAKETEEFLAGNIATKTITTIKYANNNSVDAPVLESYTANDVTLRKIDILEYSKDQENWQDSNIFTDLTPETDYTFYQRIKETNDTYASSISEGLKVKTKKENTRLPVNPEIEDVSENIVTLKYVEGYEYSADQGLTWQDSNVLKLDPLTEYKIIQRIKAYDDYGYSIVSESVFAKTEQILSNENIPDGYIPIFNDEEFNQINNTNQNYILMNDVASQFINNKDLYGIFEGNGYTITTNRNGSFQNNYGHMKNLIFETDVKFSWGCTYNFGPVINNYGLIENCISKGQIINDKGMASVAGIVLSNKKQGIVRNCKNEININSFEGYTMAGIAAFNEGTIEKCCNMGNIGDPSAQSAMGGICGSNSGSVEKSYNMGGVTGNKSYGSIIGTNEGWASNCYNTATGVLLIGSNTGTLCTSYDLGRGGLYPNNNEGKIENSYYLRLFAEDEVPSLIALTYSEMQEQESFKGFDFDTVWQIDPDSDYYFPTLREVENKAKLPKKVSVESITSNSIKIKNVDGYEYSCLEGCTEYCFDGQDFGEIYIFENLEPSKEYTICQRIKNPDTTLEEIITRITIKTKALTGDINGDGKVNITDVALINAHVKKTKLLTGDELARADINGDGKVNITDVALVNAHVKKVKLLF